MVSPLLSRYSGTPNHSEVLVGSFVTGTETELPLWLLPIPSGPPRRLGEVNAHDAGWSPDGRQIVYANGSSLYLVKSDGSETRKLTTVVGIPFAPVFSPEGNGLRFTVSDLKTASLSLWEVGVGGTGLHPLLEGWNKPSRLPSKDVMTQKLTSRQQWPRSARVACNAVRSGDSFCQSAKPLRPRVPKVAPA
jgi:hypothetical protein